MVLVKRPEVVWQTSARYGCRDVMVKFVMIDIRQSLVLYRSRTMTSRRLKHHGSHRQIYHPQSRPSPGAGPHPGHVSAFNATELSITSIMVADKFGDQGTHVGRQCPSNPLNQLHRRTTQSRPCQSPQSVFFRDDIQDEHVFHHPRTLALKMG